MQDQRKKLTFERKVIDCIATVWNPYVKNKGSSLDLTVTAFDEL
jgi:hypothetical protein